MSPWIIVPAAGVGQRFGAATPKQYQTILGKAVLQWTLEKLLAIEPQGIVVAVHPEDSRYSELPALREPHVYTVIGGASRAESVQQAINFVATHTDDQHCLLVHDAARPCVKVSDIEKMLQELAEHPVGGILAKPIGDTVKQVSGLSITNTLDRQNLWAAMTPQMFRLGSLRSALEQGMASGVAITDEASAMELAGFQPAVVLASGDNIKITHHEDLAIARAILEYQQTEGE